MPRTNQSLRHRVILMGRRQWYIRHRVISMEQRQWHTNQRIWNDFRRLSRQVHELNTLVRIEREHSKEQTAIISWLTDMYRNGRPPPPPLPIHC